ncbi:helix-turn-helix domain-containing protein [Paenibacillus chartarius]|uniref:Helix-turn-helix domain-containing protein n=1 Tax=Paenibacillus chartarius TaxID=747481 RepID=A0ABV6DR14_9BACL
MYKLLIADDELREREGLELMVSRMMPCQFEILHAENGRKAIQIAEERRPDIIFMDIQMPGIQGLDAVKEINRMLPGARIILVTAHEYFAYAKEAVTLGIKEYILKPAKRDEIIHILRKLIHELDEERGKRREELEVKEKLNRLLPLAENEMALMLLMDSIHEFDCEQLAELLDIRWEQGYAMVLSFPFKEQQDWNVFQTRRKELYEGVKPYIKSQLGCLISPLIGSRMAIFIPAASWEAGKSPRAQSLNWGERLHAWIEASFGLSAAIGIGSLKKGFEGLRQSYQEAAAAASTASSAEPICHADDLLLNGGGRSRITPEEERKLLDSLYRQNREEAGMRFSQVLERLFAEAGDNVPQCRDEIIALLISITRQQVHWSPADLLAHFDSAANIAMLRQAAIEQMERILEEVGKEREKRKFHAVERARMYLAECYKSDISLEQTAEYVNLSPFYFSKLFKLQTGETFIDYITRLRINEAKRLLELEELSFKEICYEVGYNDPSYFSRIFKKTTGFTPSEYRQQSALL